MYISRRPYTFDRVIRILFTIAVVVGVFYLIDLLKGALLPFLVAWLLAYLIHPLVDFFKKKCHIRNNFLAIITALISIILFFSLLGWIFIPSILDEIDKIKIMIQINPNCNNFHDTVKSDRFCSPAPLSPHALSCRGIFIFSTT